MYLTRDEEHVLAGDKGPVKQKAMEILVALGEIYGAEQLIRVESAQVAGVSYKTIGDSGLHWVESLSEGRVVVPTTLNPAGMDLTEWRRMGVPQEFAEKQLRIVRTYQTLGVLPTCSCTPYLLGNKPHPGCHIAWSESSAVCYVNSVLGAYTNREGGPSALASALTGLTPRHGYHLDENRKATITVDVNMALTDESSYSVLGWWIGRAIGTGVPLIRNLRYRSDDDLKALSAGVATTGSIAMFHVEGAPGEKVGNGVKSLERYTFTDSELKEVHEALTTRRVERVDLAGFGCPHASLPEIREIAGLLQGRSVRHGSRLWVFTSSYVKAQAEREGILAQIKKAGGEIYADTCMVVAPLEKMGFETIAVNSAKAATYARNISHINVVFGDAKQCIELSCSQ